MAVYKPKTHEEKGAEFTHQSIEHAFDLHRESGLIKSWWRDARTLGASGTRSIPLYWVTTAGPFSDVISLANVWEARALLFGLASAKQAHAQEAGR